MESEFSEEWLSQIERKVIDDNDRVLFQEALSCLRNKLFRAAYIMAWITLIESLKRKIHYLSSLNDARAIKAEAEITKNEDDNLSQDKLIFFKAKECEIITQIEFNTVGFLWTQRCIFAHPYNQMPTYEELKHIFSQIIIISLSQENLFGTKYVDELIPVLETPYITGTGYDEMMRYAQNKVMRIKPSVYPSFYKKLLAKIGSSFDDPDRYIACRRYRAFVVSIISQVGSEIEKEIWVLENRSENYPFSVWFGAVSTSTWQYFPMKVKDLLIRYLLQEKDDRKQRSLFNIMYTLMVNNVVELNFYQRFLTYLEKIDFDTCIEYYPDKEKYDRIITELSKYDFENQTKVVYYLKTDRGKETMSEYNVNQKFMLGRTLQNSAKNKCWTTENYLTGMLSQPDINSHPIMAGIVFGYFINLSNEFTRRWNFDKILQTIELLDEENILLIKNEFLIGKKDFNIDEHLHSTALAEYEKYKTLQKASESKGIKTIEELINLITPNITEI